ncbi:hypothetical protein [Actinoplanes derwentensis]|uniref:LemA protein n=1 Tax=Actinoplanes derwentensis TaxID=113562 RepID=A0A1H2DCN9_9ACTN|nr:hypothetical protein [Actinoplanes derwentensis]GID90408.1 hypothetical protein Ade03nite_93320 [Actinoplanes derwentensis]SDT80471.1 hypothetical protein SAMN04489716_9217 [Actinoplanes derwentensis]
MERSRVRQLAVAASAVIGLGAAAALIVWHDTVTGRVGAEAYKALLQFVLIVVLGGGVSLLVQAFNREADRRTERLRQRELHATGVQEARQRYLRELVDQYNAVKRARRLLRATALTHAVDPADRSVRVARYDELMEVLLDAQLSLETMARTVPFDGSVFTSVPELIAAICTTEEYLRRLITEYEQVRPQAAQPEVGIGMLPELALFVGPYADAERFRTQFVRPVNTAVALAQRAVTEPPD